jgi:hypothetical protein
MTEGSSGFVIGPALGVIWKEELLPSDFEFCDALLPLGRTNRLIKAWHPIAFTWPCLAKFTSVTPH